MEPSNCSVFTMSTKTAKPFTLIVDGIIGAGKSTLINEGLIPRLREKGWRVTLIKEPAADCGEILERFYADPRRWAYHFQTKAFHDRVREFCKMWTDNYETTDIFISERSVMSDTLFMSTLHTLGDIDDLEWDHYMQWWSMWSEIVPMRPDLFVYLDPDVGEAMGRIKTRGRKGEENIESSYQELLKEKHDAMFIVDSIKVTPDHTAPVLHLKTNSDFKNNIRIRDDIVDRIEVSIIAGMMPELRPVLKPVIRYLVKRNNHVVAASNLDNIIMCNEGSITAWLACPYTGAPIRSAEDREAVERIAIDRIMIKKHLTTDHTPIVFKLGDDTLTGYISLENSNRSEKAGAGLGSRLNNIAGLMNELIKQGVQIIFLNEACRQLTKSMSWKDTAYTLELLTGFVELGNARNDVNNTRSLGLSCFVAKKNGISPLRDLYPIQLTNNSVVYIVRYNSGAKAMIVHYPVDFNNTGDNHLGVIANRRAMQLAREHGISAIVGDMNLIDGGGEIMRREVEAKYRYVFDRSEATFYGAFCDLIAIDTYDAIPHCKYSQCV